MAGVERWVSTIDGPPEIAGVACAGGCGSSVGFHRALHLPLEGCDGSLKISNFVSTKFVWQGAFILQMAYRYHSRSSKYQEAGKVVSRVENADDKNGVSHTLQLVPEAIELLKIIKKPVTVPKQEVVLHLSRGGEAGDVQAGRDKGQC